MARHSENIYKRKDRKYEGRYVIGKKIIEKRNLAISIGITIWKFGTPCSSKKPL